MGVTSSITVPHVPRLFHIFFGDVEQSKPLSHKDFLYLFHMFHIFFYYI